MQSERGHGKVPDTARAKFLKRGSQVGFGRRQDDFGEDLVEPDHMGLDSAVHEHVAGHKLLDGQFFRSGGCGQFHMCIERNQRDRGVARIHGIAQPAAHRGMVIAVVADRAVANVAAISPARITAAQILAPDFLQQVATDG